MGNKQRRCPCPDPQITYPPIRPRKKSWPFLLGKSAREAVSVIRSEEPYLNVIAIGDRTPVPANLDYSRVFVKYDSYGRVSEVPRIG